MTENIISHSADGNNFADNVALLKNKIIAAGDEPHVSAQRQLDLLAQLCDFELGKFIIQNRGLDGFWTHYILTYPMRKSEPAYANLSQLEHYLLQQAPIILATQQRFQIFLQQAQAAVKNNATLASLPSGMLGDLLYLNYQAISNIKLVAIDADANALSDAKKLANELGLSKFVTLQQTDAWQLNANNCYDLITSNGLNIYEPDNNKVTELYKLFFKSLKPGGRLITSFVTPPPTEAGKCSWDMQKINSDDLLLQRIIFADILDAKWQCYRSEAETAAQLSAAGFANYKFIYDNAKLFPTVVAEK